MTYLCSPLQGRVLIPSWREACHCTLVLGFGEEQLINGGGHREVSCKEM